MDPTSALLLAAMDAIFNIGPEKGNSSPEAHLWCYSRCLPPKNSTIFHLSVPICKWPLLWLAKHLYIQLCSTHSILNTIWLWIKNLKTHTQYIYIHIYLHFKLLLLLFSHLADAFVQSDLQMRAIEAIKTNKRATTCKCYDKSWLA